MAKTKRQKLVSAGTILLLVAVGLVYYFLIKNNPDDGIARETDLNPYYLNEGQNGSITDIEDVSVARQDLRASDGPFTCTIYRTDTRLILATYRLIGGVTAPGSDTRPKTTYRSEELSKKQIDEIIKKYCDDTPRTFIAPHPDR